MLTFRAINPERDRALVIPNRRDSFVVSFGSDTSYGRDEDYLAWLTMRAEQFPLGQVLAFEGKENVGQIEAMLREGGKVGYVNLYYLRPEYRGRGYGKLLQEYAEMFFRPFHVERMELRVSKTNASAIRFYEKMGFEVAYEEEMRDHTVYRMQKDMRERVEIVDYDPRWPLRYEEERAAIVQALGDDIVAIEHIGSTSIPGLCAKPILDIQVGVKRMVPAQVLEERLQRLGYRQNPEADDPNRRLFYRKGKPRTHHLHIMPVDSWDFERHVLFRDYLRKHPVLRDQYGQLKRELAEQHGHNRQDYTDAKTTFVESVVALAQAERGES